MQQFTLAVIFAAQATIFVLFAMHLAKHGTKKVRTSDIGTKTKTVVLVALYVLLAAVLFSIYMNYV